MAEPTGTDDGPTSVDRGFVTGAVWAALERLDRPELDTQIVNNGLGNRLILTLFGRRFWINVEAGPEQQDL